MTEQTKTCTKCGIEKPATTEFFYKNATCRLGLCAHCKVCEKVYKGKNRNKRKEYDKDYYENNKENIQAYKKAYRESNKDEIAAKNKAYHENNKEEIKSRKKAYRESNKDKIAAKNKSYYESNKEKIKTQRATPERMERRNELLRIRRKTDIQSKLRDRLRSRLHDATKKGYKTGSAVQDLGCTIEELKQHLEVQFKPGMTWENWTHGGWHIDHIVPLASFDLTDREQFLKACHYTNLQPLWAVENLQKGAK